MPLGNPSPALRRAALPAALALLAMTAIALAVVVLPRPHGAPSPVRTNTSPPPVDLVDRVGSFVAGFSGTDGYRTPDPAERAHLSRGVELVLNGRTAAAREELSNIGFTVRVLRLTGSNRQVAEVSEESVTEQGWGRVYVDLSRPARWSVQVPHPRSDLRSELIGADLFERVPGGVLVLAGAPRDVGRGNAADVAHRRDSAFNAVCDLLVARGLPAVQVHGFADESSPGHDVVVSPGAAAPGPDVRRAADLIAAAGERVCRVWEQSCGRLEGTTNVQSAAAVEHGVPFLHIENSRGVRDDEAARARVAGALADVVERWNR
ncbi:hypothetical protein [Streptomyces sp. SPB162]|uniref:hypothetical protein n=1 Tax=Streptomyces sp. SPB162 TaxID=2940560 RepID=UPI0024059E96|nr:hypothetical protein [Streptomyces sp. SPB162]MDF9814241.1 hypothetical protein [Streptomyces sp. SPB162]